MTYARDTSVSVGRSKEEIEHLLSRYGADQFLSGWDMQEAHIAFRMHGKSVKLTLPLPDRNADEFQLTGSRKWRRSDADALKAWEQACRARWRALKLIIQAKLEGIELGVSTFEREFLSDLMLPDGRTYAEHAIPAMERFYETGKMPALLPGGKD